jgi:hypothetical protein
MKVASNVFSRASFLWIAVLLVPLIEIGYHGYVELQVPSQADWEKAASIVQREFKNEDLVVITPWWATEGWVYLGKFMSIEKMARDDDRGYGRIWEVAWKHRSREDYGKEGKLLKKEKAGRLVVRLWSFPDAPATLYDFVREIENASVEMADSEGVTERACTFKKHVRTVMTPSPMVQTGKFMCNPSIPWNNVDREVIADLENKPRLCIWSHPITNKTVRIKFEGVPAGAFIEGHTGLKYEADRETAGKPPVFLDIFAGGTLAGSAMHEEGGGWTSYRYKMPGGWKGGRLTFEVHTPFDGMQHFCFTGKLRDR